MTKDEKLKSIIDYIEYANLVFVEPFSLISATVVEASYWTGISKNTILVHINRFFKEKYGEQYIKAQKIAHDIAYGKNPNAEKIMSKDVSNELQANTLTEPKERKKYEHHKDKSEYKLREPTTVFGVAYKEYTGLNMRDNKKLYVACHHYYKRYKKFLWEDLKKWQKACKKYGFEDKKLKEKEA